MLKKVGFLLSRTNFLYSFIPLAQYLSKLKYEITFFVPSILDNKNNSLSHHSNKILVDEYHTSLDNLSLLTETSLKDSISILYRCLVCIEENKKINVNTLCEPHLSKYNLYGSLNINRRLNNESRIMLNILTYADDRYLLDIADIIGVPMWDLYKIKNTLLKNKLVTENF